MYSLKIEVNAVCLKFTVGAGGQEIKREIRRDTDTAPAFKITDGQDFYKQLDKVIKKGELNNELWLFVNESEDRLMYVMELMKEYEPYKKGGL